MAAPDPVAEGVIRSESQRRRTFAIISHPDAGKTTLTEKLLLYTGQIREAGEVKAKAERRKTVSDWMELEQERGISVSSSVLQFEYENLRVNILDTPGHKDFSEDTYRTLMAADTAVMVIDAAKGVELQTRKLFEVCRMRGLPVLTFVNKMDREALDPFELLEQIEEVLGIAAIPLSWPIGMGDRFKGVYDRAQKEFHLFESSGAVGRHEADIKKIQCTPQDKKLLEYIEEEQFQKFQDDIEIVDGALGSVTREDYLDGLATPTLFGSAKNNFGILNFLEKFKEYAPPPLPKKSTSKLVKPEDKDFSGFIFKIQANMDKSHRDRMAFMRICSGVFQRDMDVKHTRLEKTVRLTHSKQFWAQERETVDHAFAGDIIGIHDPGHFQIGDTIYTGPKIEFTGIPQFSPECFAKVQLKDPLKRKHLQKGIKELSEEGLVQVFIQEHIGNQDPILAVVGVLQFDVMMFRIKDEYRVDAKIERLPYKLARWATLKDESLSLKSLNLRGSWVKDSKNNDVALFNSDWEFDFTKRNLGEKVEWSLSSPA